MKRVLEPGDGRAHLPIHLWAHDAPEAAVAQLARIAAQPYAVGHIAGMPDLHVASGVAVGTVFASDGVIVPAALGGDLGCGVTALRFPLDARSLSTPELRQILARWSTRIPVGDAIHRARDAPAVELPTGTLSTGALEHAAERLGRRHLGTLGGGNHFVELDRSIEGEVWLLVHSGSRGMGSAVASHHLRAADSRGLRELDGLPIDSSEGQGYLRDLRWSLAFAALNRSVLTARAAEIVSERTGVDPDPATRIDVHHNFAAEESHFGRQLWVHRKGAISAPLGSRVVIPGSMGTASYIAEGLGESSSFASASHGAGRTMTRREARDRISAPHFARSMRRVVYDERRFSSLVEEAPMAYRNITEVLEDETDLVAPRIRLEPLLVLKG